MFPPRSEDRPKRWPRGQKFTLSAEGATAEESYRAAVASARARGRAALDAALAAWAAPLGVHPGDGVLLSQLREVRRGIGELSSALEDAGIAAEEVRAAIERLVASGAVTPVPLASQLA